MPKVQTLFKKWKIGKSTKKQKKNKLLQFLLEDLFYMIW